MNHSPKASSVPTMPTAQIAAVSTTRLTPPGSMAWRKVLRKAASRAAPKDVQNSAFDLAFDNGASKSNSLSVGCGRKRNASNKCYHASSNRRVGG